MELASWYFVLLALAQAEMQMPFPGLDMSEFCRNTPLPFLCPEEFAKQHPPQPSCKEAPDRCCLQSSCIMMGPYFLPGIGECRWHIGQTVARQRVQICRRRLAEQESASASRAFVRAMAFAWVEVAFLECIFHSQRYTRMVSMSCLRRIRMADIRAGPLGLVDDIRGCLIAACMRRTAAHGLAGNQRQQHRGACGPLGKCTRHAAF
eukprot:s2836_g13.t3